MLDRQAFEEKLSAFPLYMYAWIDPAALTFSDRIRYICQHECPMYGKTWACPPGVGEVCDCKAKCNAFSSCLMIGTITETADIADIAATLATRGDHEAITNEIGALLKEAGYPPYILSTEACAECEKCAILDGQPCRKPDRMHPCIESHGIVLTDTLEELGFEFQYGDNMVTWYSLLFFNE